MDATEPLGEKLRRLRKERGLTLTEFAGKVGVSRPTVWSWESGKSRPRNQKLESVAAALDLAEGELILDQDEVEKKRNARSLQREIAAAKVRIAKLAGIGPDQVDIIVRW